MKFTLNFLSLFLSLTLHAQFAPFPTKGLEFGSIYVCNMYDCPTYQNSSMRFVSDTVVCGHKWMRFTFLPELAYSVLLRAEQGQYFSYLQCNNEILLYDFSKNTGDTVVTGDLGPLLVIDTGTFTLDNGEQRKKMVLQSLNPISPEIFTWVDGIGDINRAFFRSSDFEGGHGQLICVKDSSAFYYHNPNPEFIINCDSLLCPEPQPSFDYWCAGMTFHFTNLSKESDHYLWEFGDGETSAEANPTHTFANPGCYNVRLSAKSDCLPQAFPFVKKIALNSPFFWRKSADDTPGDIWSMQFLDPQHGWALGDQKIWKTSDGGAHWDTVPYPGPVRPLDILHFKDFEHGIVQVFKPGPPYYYSEILWTNNGKDWDTQTLGSNDHPSVTALERINDSVAIVAAHYDNLYVTKNWGQTWEHIAMPWAASLINDIEYVGGDTVYFIGVNQITGTSKATVFGKTYDLTNWSVQEFPTIYSGYRLSFINGEEGWMSNRSSVYHTIDGGQSWTQQLSAYVNDLDFNDSLHGWAAGYSGIFGTKDGGLSWEEEACVRAGEKVSGLNVFSPQQAYVLFEDGLYYYQEIPDTVISCPLSRIPEPAAEQGRLFSIYPNPSRGEIRIHWDETPDLSSELVIFNAQGVELMRWQAAGGEDVSLKDLPGGIYFLQARSNSAKRLSGGVQKLILIK